MLTGYMPPSFIEKQMPNSDADGTPTWNSFADFLANAPPDSYYKGDDIVVVQQSAVQDKLNAPTLQLYCSECDAAMNFDTDEAYYVGRSYQEFVAYHCRHCLGSHLCYALIGQHDNDDSWIMKIGQYPAFNPPVPAKLQRLIQDDRETFFKGRRAESMNLGVGAFAYYRRVVESQKDRLCDKIIQVAKRLGYSADMIRELEAAKAKWQFMQGVQGIKDAIPEAFQINGHNPLTLLHNALSEGVHSLSDEECLARAQDARTVLVALAERLAALSADHRGLNDAVTRLANKKSGTN